MAELGNANKQIESLVNYRYKITGVDLLLPKKDPIKIEPERLSDIQIIKDYDNSFFPIFKTVLALSAQMLYDILDNKTDVKFRIRLEYYKHAEDNKKTTSKIVFNDIFTVFIDEDTPSFDPKLMKEAHKNEKVGSDNTLTSFGSSLELYLFKESYLNSSKQVINKVISSSTMTDAVSYLLSKSGAKDVLMDVFDNKTSFSEVILPPFTVLGNLTYLEKQYGFYNTYATIFYDFDTIYFLNRNNKCTSWKKNEKKRVILNISSEDSKTGFLPGISDEKDNYIVLVSKSAVKFNNDSLSKDQTRGNNMVSINSNSGSVKQVNSQTVQRGSGSTQVVVNKYDNPYMESAEKYDREENAVVAALEVNDFDITYLTPNKEFSFVFEDNRLNSDRGGIYRLSKAVFNLQKQGEFYGINGLMSFKSNGTKRNK